jgi:hypothetical protein
MATIKLQNGKVVLKDGKASCTCCIRVCNGSFLITDRNVFEITKSEYNAYINGGTWDIQTTWVHNESYSGYGYLGSESATAVGGGSANSSKFSEGCVHSVSGTISTSVLFTIIRLSGTNTFTVNSVFSTGMGLSLKVYENKYYARYNAYSVVSDSDVYEPNRYPRNVNFTIQGSRLDAYGAWIPGWSDRPNYTNNSTSTLTATFTPIS